MSCRIKVTIVRLQDLRKFKTKGVTYVTCVFLLQRGIFKMNLIFDFLIGRPQPNNLFWMFSTICTTSCELGKSGIDLFAIDVLLVVVAELGACNWLSACYKPVSFHLRKNRTTKSKKNVQHFSLVNGNKKWSSQTTGETDYYIHAGCHGRVIAYS